MDLKRLRGRTNASPSCGDRKSPHTVCQSGNYLQTAFDAGSGRVIRQKLVAKAAAGSKDPARGA